MLSQRQVKNLVFADIAAAKAAGRPGEVCYVQSMKTFYDYVVAGSGYTANDTSILTTGNGGDTRWRARAGQYVEDVTEFMDGLKTADPVDEHGVGDVGFNDARYQDVYKNITIDAAEMVPCTTNGALQGTNEYGTNDIDVDYFAFDAGATKERTQFKYEMPENWDRGTIKGAKFKWSSAAGSTAGDTCEFGMKAQAGGDGDAIDVAFADGGEVISDVLLADNGGDWQRTAKTSEITVGGTPAVGDTIIFEIWRNTDGTDNMAEDAWLFGVAFQIKLSGAVALWT